MNTLDTAQEGIALHVKQVRSHPNLTDCDQQLMQIGFIPGEQVTVQRRGRSNHNPIVVRVGGATFALRREEASCVLVEKGNIS
jgi:ferrous iron transport protein A